MTSLPRETDVIVVVGGTAGTAVAARLAERGVEVLVLEAGPDPGPFGDPRGPADLVDATRLGTSYDWGFGSGSTYGDQVVRFERTRVLGGRCWRRPRRASSGTRSTSTCCRTAARTRATAGAGTPERAPSARARAGA